MKTRFITFLTSCFALVILLNASPVLSQDIAQTLKNMSPEQKAMAVTMIMKSKLGLDTIQTAKVKTINLKYGPKTEALLKSDANKFSKLKQFRDIQKDKDAEFKAVMNADQFKKYQEMEEEMKEKLKEKMKDRKQ